MSQRHEELKSRLAVLYAKWEKMEGLTREWCESEIREVQAGLKAQKPLDLEKQYREGLVELSQLAALISSTTREAPIRRKSELIRSLVERIECSFEYQQFGSQTRSRLISVKFVPLGEAPEVNLRSQTSLGPG